jgi:hypothetical protein
MAIRILPWLILPLLASCVAPSSPPPVQPSPRSQTQAPATGAPAAPAGSAPERYAGEWSVAELAPGDWTYSDRVGSSAARFGNGGPVQVSIACVEGRIMLSRLGVAPAGEAAFLNVRNSFAERRLPTQRGNSENLSALLPASDPLWDQIIFSRGRFLIEATGQAPIIVPTRGDIARVIEDCRG